MQNKLINNFKTTRGEEIQVFSFVEGIVCFVNTTTKTMKFIKENDIRISDETQECLNNLGIFVKGL